MKERDKGTAACGSGKTPRVVQVPHPGGSCALLGSAEQNRDAGAQAIPFGLEEDSSHHLYASVAVVRHGMKAMLLMAV